MDLQALAHEPTSPFDTLRPAPAHGLGSAPLPVPTGDYQMPAELERILDTGRGLAQTPGGNSDLARQADREAAKKQLAGQFQIISDKDAKDPKKQKDRAPNAVTQAEFDKLVATYSNIRLGEADLKMMDGVSKDFRDGAMNDIAAILQTPSGRELIEGLANNVTKGVHHTTKLRWGKKANALTDKSTSKDADAFNGVGVNEIVQWNPGVDAKSDFPDQEDWYPMRSDVTLYHELTHALHATRGVSKGGREEEYRTVGLKGFDKDKINENTYRAERAKMAGKVGERDKDAGMKRRRGYSEYRE